MAIYSLTKWTCTPKGRHGWGLQTGRFTVAAMATHCSKSLTVALERKSLENWNVDGLFWQSFLACWTSPQNINVT